jgi:N-acetylmuramoyl-L-alanine amidase
MHLWRKAPAVALLSFLPVLAAPNSGLIQVTGVRSWSHPDSTRVIIQTSGPFDFRSDRAVNPERLFFDILHARPWIDSHRFATREIGDKLVRRVRIAETSPGTTRIVFDMSTPADFTATKLDAPDRLVVEFRPLHSTPAKGYPVVSSAPAGLSTATVVRPVRREFVYPPPPPHAQVIMPGGAPSLPLSPVLIPFYFADPISSLITAISTRPEKQSPTASARSVQAVRPPVVTTPVVTTPVPGNSASPASATASENAARSMTRALGLKVNRIVIDAGHGGHDDGTIGPHGVVEKDVVLDVALRLAKLIQERMTTEVVLTRSDDTFIPLHERTAVANERKADLFLSIHANSSPAPEVAGTETFFLNFTNAPDALNVAARENAGSEKSVGELRDLIQTITLNDKIEESHTFAQDIQNSIQAQAARSNTAAHNRGVKRAPFVVLIGASMPSVLAEIGFLSNSRDESNLGKPDYRQKIAEALYKGVAQYSQSLSHFEPVRQIAKSGP